MVNIIMIRDTDGSERSCTIDEIEEYVKRDKPEGTVIFYAAFSATKLHEIMKECE